MQDLGFSRRLEENIGHLSAPSLYAVSLMHCLTVSLAQGGAGPGAMWGEQTGQRMLAEAGFRHIDVQRLQGDPLNAYSSCGHYPGP